MSNRHGPAQRERGALMARDMGDAYVAAREGVQADTVAGWRREFGVSRPFPSLPRIDAPQSRELSDAMCLHEGRTPYTGEVCWYWACVCGETKYCGTEEAAEADALTHQCWTEEQWEEAVAAEYRRASQYGPDVLAQYDDYRDSDYFDMEPLGVGGD